MDRAEEQLQVAWRRAAGTCECRRAEHGHDAKRCGRLLFFTHRGQETFGGWEAVGDAGGHGSRDDANPLELLCWPCFKRLDARRSQEGAGRPGPAPAIPATHPGTPLPLALTVERAAQPRRRARHREQLLRWTGAGLMLAGALGLGGSIVLALPGWVFALGESFLAVGALLTIATWLWTHSRAE